MPGYYRAVPPGQRQMLMIVESAANHCRPSPGWLALPSHSEIIAATVPGAKLVVLPVVHLSNLESPDIFMKAVLGFLL